MKLYDTMLCAAHAADAEELRAQPGYRDRLDLHAKVHALDIKARRGDRVVEVIEYRRNRAFPPHVIYEDAHGEQQTTIVERLVARA